MKLFLPLFMMAATCISSCKKNTVAANASYIGNYISEAGPNTNYLPYLTITNGANDNEVLIIGMGSTPFKATLGADPECLVITHQPGDGHNCFVSGGGCQGYVYPHADLELTATDSCANGGTPYAFEGYKY